MKGTILVAGIGNIFLGDDAFGCVVVQRLASRALPPQVCVVDFGIRGYDLAYALMEPWELAILVDANPRHGAPGTLYAIEAAVPDSADGLEFDAHSMNPVAVLKLVAHLGGNAPRTIVIGCEPESAEENSDGRFGLSPPVEAAIEQAIQMIEEFIASTHKATAA